MAFLGNVPKSKSLILRPTEKSVRLEFDRWMRDKYPLPPPEQRLSLLSLENKLLKDMINELQNKNIKLQQSLQKPKLPTKERDDINYVDYKKKSIIDTEKHCIKCKQLTGGPRRTYCPQCLLEVRRIRFRKWAKIAWQRKKMMKNTVPNNEGS